MPPQISKYYAAPLSIHSRNCLQKLPEKIHLSILQFIEASDVLPSRFTLAYAQSCRSMRDAVSSYRLHQVTSANTETIQNNDPNPTHLAPTHLDSIKLQQVQLLCSLALEKIQLAHPSDQDFGEAHARVQNAIKIRNRIKKGTTHFSMALKEARTTHIAIKKAIDASKSESSSSNIQIKPQSLPENAVIVGQKIDPNDNFSGKSDDFLIQALLKEDTPEPQKAKIKALLMTRIQNSKLGFNFKFYLKRSQPRDIAMRTQYVNQLHHFAKLVEIFPESENAICKTLDECLSLFQSKQILEEIIALSSKKDNLKGSESHKAITLLLASTTQALKNMNVAAELRKATLRAVALRKETKGKQEELNREIDRDNVTAASELFKNLPLDLFQTILTSQGYKEICQKMRNEWQFVSLKNSIATQMLGSLEQELKQPSLFNDQSLEALKTAFKLDKSLDLNAGNRILSKLGSQISTEDVIKLVALMVDSKEYLPQPLLKYMIEGIKKKSPLNQDLTQKQAENLVTQLGRILNKSLHDTHGEMGRDAATSEDALSLKDCIDSLFENCSVDFVKSLVFYTFDSGVLKSSESRLAENFLDERGIEVPDRNVSFKEAVDKGFYLS